MAPRTPAQSAALERVKSKPTGSYYLWGFYATGKTHLLIAQYQRLALAGVPCMLRSSRQLADEMRKAEMAPPAGEEPYESPVLRLMESQAHVHLFIDDIEKTPARTDFRAEAAFHWLDTLKRRQHGLTVTSNLPLEALTGYLGDAAVARIMRVCERVQL
jgi:DNA replication protein DnaC